MGTTVTCLIVDLILVAVIAIAAYIGWRKGIVKMLLSFLSILLALILAYALAAPAAKIAYEKFFESSVSASVDAALEGSSVNTVSDAVANLLDSGSVIGGIGKLLGFETEKTVASLQGNTVSEIAEHVKVNVVRPPLELLLKILAFILLFLLVWLILTIISHAIMRASKLPLVRGVNAFFGGAVGFITGVLLCVCLCALFNKAIAVNPGGLFGIDAITRDNSIVYRLIDQYFLHMIH